MSAEKPTIDDVLDSLTGFEEIAIDQKFGHEVYDLLGTSTVKACRALVFILKKRDGQDDKTAYKSVMEMTLSAVNAHFGDADDEPMPEEPVTDAGKGDSTAA